MRPPSQVELRCWLCPMTFKTRRQLKNHLAAAPHKRLSVICVWCTEEKTYRRMVDLKEHIMACHRSKIELMPNSFLTENNGFWMANYPETYAKVITPSNENSVEAMKARIEVLEFISRTGNTIRTKEQWIQGWKCPKELILGTEEDDVRDAPKKIYSPSRPNMYEDIELKALTLGINNCTAIFQLDLGVTIREYEVIIKDDVMKEPRMLDSLIRRMTALMSTNYVKTKPFGGCLEGELGVMLGKIISRKLAVKEEYIDTIRTTEELFPTRKQSSVKPISPLRTPSTSNITLDEIDNMQEEHVQETDTQERQGKKHKHKTEENKGRKKRKIQDKNKDSVSKGQKDVEEKKQHEETLRKEEEEALRRKEEVERKKKHEEALRMEEEESLRRKEEVERKKKHEEALRKEEEEALRRKEEVERKKKQHEETLRKEEEETLRRKEEVERKKKHEEALRKEEEEALRRKEEVERKKKHEEALRMEEEESLRRKEEVECKKKQEEALRKEKDNHLIEEASNEDDYEAEEDIRLGEEKEEKDTEENGPKKGKEDNPRKEDQDTQDSGSREGQPEKELSKSERATLLLKTGGMPLFPPGRRDWKEDQVVTLITIPTTLKWPPKDSKKMTSEEKYFNWEFASIALELSLGTPLQLSKEELLLKYHFLALPGTKTPSTEEIKTFEVKSRFYLYTVLSQITQGKTSTESTIQLLAMLEKATDLRDKSLDSVLAKIDELGIGLRLVDIDEN